MNRKKLLLSLLVGSAAFLVCAVAFAAEDAAAVATTVAKFEAYKWIAIAAGIGIAIAAFGGALGQGRTASAALDGIARNPGAADKLFTPMILGLVLIESLVIYALLIALLLWLKIAF